MLVKKEKEPGGFGVFSDTETWKADLSTKWAGKNLLSHAELDSTNMAAARAGDTGAPHGTLIVADKQTRGRGRRGRTWESPAGKNLYFSLLLRPEFPPEQASMLTLVMAHSVARAVEETVYDSKRARCEEESRQESKTGSGYGTEAAKPGIGIKWPNDILIHGKKVCGILTELKADKGRIRHIIIGVGINVKPQIFEGELSEKASSLEQECGVEISRELLLCNIMKTFEADYEAFVEEGNLTPLLEGYQNRLLNRDARVKVLDPQETFEGIARGITKTGELIVEKDDESVIFVYAGEVSVRGLLGYV